MPTNDFLPFATGIGANVVDEATYSALAARLTGFQAGTASSAQINKALRQSTSMAALLGQLIADYSGTNAVDDGNISNLEAALKLALASIFKVSVPGSLIQYLQFSTSGVYTPSTGMQFCVVEGVGGGGAGGGCTNPSAGTVSMGAPGGSGAYGRSLFTRAQIGGSQTITIGAGGVPVVGGAGGNGGTTSVGSLLSIPGGVGGGMFNNQTPPSLNGNGNTTANPTGANVFGRPGGVSSFTQAISTTYGSSGQGGDSPFGTGGYGITANVAGTTGVGKGSGGSGSLTTAGNGSNTGGAGAPGIIIVAEYGVAAIS